MKTAILFMLLAELSLTAAAPPPRDTGLNIPTAQSIQILAACIEKRLGEYREKDIPGGGISIQVGERQRLFIHYEPFLYYDLTEIAGNRNIHLSYRHPISKGAAAKNLRMIGRKCFPYEFDAAGGGVLPGVG